MNPRTVYERHHAELLRYLTRLTGDADEAADAAQETYLRLVRQPRSDLENAAAWLFRVATNIVRDRWKHRTHERKLWSTPERVPIGDPPEDPHAALERSEAQQFVHRLMERLSLRERTALLMRERGFTHREIAEAIDTTTQSVGTIIARALRKLQRDLEQGP